MLPEVRILLFSFKKSLQFKFSFPFKYPLKFSNAQKQPSVFPDSSSGIMQLLKSH